MKIQKGDVLDYTNNGAATIEYQAVVPLGTKRIGIAAAKIAVGDVGSVEVVGVHQLAAESGVAFEFGDDLYWDNTNKRLSKTSAGNCYAGWCFSQKASAAVTACVKIG